MITKQFTSDKMFERAKSQVQVNNSMQMVFENELNYLDRIDKMNLTFSFGEYQAAPLVSQHGYFEFSQILFQQKKQSIFSLLILPENDCTVYALINHVFMQHRKVFLHQQGLTTGAYEHLFGTQNQLVHRDLHERRRSARLMPPAQLLHHQKASDVVFDRTSARKKRLRSFSMCCESFAQNKSNMIRGFERQDAVNHFGDAFCEELVHEILQASASTVKASQLLLYSRILRWVKSDDKTLAADFKNEFGFKSKLKRDLHFPMQITETFHPTCIAKAERKIKLLTSKISERRKLPPVFKHALNRWDDWEEERRPEKMPRSKEMAFLQPEEFLTDDSMREFDYDDVKSDQSLNDLSDQSQGETDLNELKKKDKKIKMT